MWSVQFKKAEKTEIELTLRFRIAERTGIKLSVMFKGMENIGIKKEKLTLLLSRKLCLLFFIQQK